MTVKTNIPRPSGYIGLMEQLAAELGVDLSQLIDEGTVSEHTVERMMHHCAACSDSSACTRLLATHRGHMADPPSFCTNRKLMQELQRQMRSHHPKPVK
jgi:hypothetical protein